MLAVFRLAGKDILIIGQTGPPKDTRTRKSQSFAKEKPSNKGLDSNDRSRFMERSPEHRIFHASMTATQCMALHRMDWTLVV